MKTFLLCCLSFYLLACGENKNSDKKETVKANSEQKDSKPPKKDTIPKYSFSFDEIYDFNTLPPEQKESYLKRNFNKLLDFRRVKFQEPIDASEAVINIRTYDQRTSDMQETRMGWYHIDSLLNFALTAKRLGATGIRIYFAIDPDEAGSRVQYRDKRAVLAVATIKISGAEVDYFDEAKSSALAIRDKGDLCPPGACPGAILLDYARRQ